MTVVNRSSSAVVRIFASHPVALRQYTLALSASADLRIVSGDEAFTVGVFDGDPLSIDQAVAVARIKAPDIRPVLISDQRDDRECLRCILRGIWGIVAYGRYDEELPAAVRHVAAGQLWFQPQVVKRWMQVDAELHARAQRTVLTDREREVVELLVRRLSNREIASVLRITERTVKFHVTNVLAKLHVRSRQELSTIWLRSLQSA